MLKVGLIGAGFMGDMHSACYAAIGKEKVCIAGVADAEPDKAEKISKAHGARVYPDAMAMIESDEIDIIDICLPTYLHAQYAQAAVEHGKAVFIEKPVCRTLDEAQKLITLQEQTGANIMVGQCIRMWPEYRWLKNAMEQKLYGSLETLVLKRVSPRPDWAWNNWLHQQDLSGGVALDMHIHDVDFMRYLLGEPKSVNSVVSCSADGEINQIFASYAYDHTAVQIEAAWDYPATFPFCMEYRAKFEKASVVFSSQSGTFMVYPNDGACFTPELDVKELGENQAGGNLSSLAGYYDELSYFIDRLHEGKPIEISTLQDATGSLALALSEIENALKVR